MVVLSRGTEVLHDGTKYRIDGVIAIDALTTTYAVSGDGPCKVLSTGIHQPDDIEILPGSAGFNPLMDVEPLFHYSVDWDQSLVHGDVIWGVVLNPNVTNPEIRYLIFAPFYISTIKESDLDVPTRDYHMISKDGDLDAATEKLEEALNKKKEYFVKKVESYDNLLATLSHDEDIRF